LGFKTLAERRKGIASDPLPGKNIPKSSFLQDKDLPTINPCSNPIESIGKNQRAENLD